MSEIAAERAAIADLRMSYLHHRLVQQRMATSNLGPVGQGCCCKLVAP
jgi:hypothetical protein